MPTTQPMTISPTSRAAGGANAASAASATAATAAGRTVSAYASRTPFRKLAFIVGLLVATVFHRSAGFMARVYERFFGKVDVVGAELIPQTGSFTLAVNHFHGSWTPFVVAAVLAAVRRGRPEVVDDIAIVIGQRADNGKKRFFIARWIRAVVLWVLEKWKHNIVNIPLGNTTVSIDSLRTWKRVAKERPTLVFPEGLANVTFERVRPNAGVFARSLNVPCVPCAVWCYQGRWYVQFGEPILWAENPELSDLQVGLSIARLLPADLTPKWQGLLDRWQRAHDAGSA